MSLINLVSIVVAIYLVFFVIVYIIIPGPKRLKQFLSEFTKGKKLTLITIIVWILLTCLTGLSIRVVYGEFLVKKWPWQFSSIMATLTCLWTYTFWFFRVASNSEDSSSHLGAVLYGVAIVPLNYLLCSPELKTLGLSSDEKALWFIGVLAILHGLGFYAIQRGIVKLLIK